MNYFRGLKYIKNILNISSPNPISVYLENPRKWEHFNLNYSYTCNRQAFDMGIPHHKRPDKDFVTQYIHTLNKDFKLILIKEYFDESLVLLKRYLCWKLEDIVYLSQNIVSLNVSITLSDVDMGRLKTWQEADFQLYQYFYAELWKKIAKEGPEFFDEVHHFKEVSRLVKHMCRNSFGGKGVTIQATQWNSELTLLKQDCNIMREGIFENLEEIKKRAWTKIGQNYLKVVPDGP